jgi:hypothetical protein
MDENQLPEEEIIRLKTWFNVWAEREGETVVWHKEMDAALVGKAQVWRAGKFRWVPVYDWHRMMEIVHEELEVDCADFVDTVYVNKYSGHMTPIIDMAPKRIEHVDVPEEEYDPYDDSSVDDDDIVEEEE